MNKTKLMLAMIAACAALAGCAKKDFDAVTGTTDFTSVALSNDSTAYHIVAGADGAVTLAPVATLEPQGVIVANGSDNMTFSFANPDVAHINDDGNLQGFSAGSTTVTVTYTDVDHNFATTTLDIPITVSAAPVP
jgi:Bacterial Ig-like domain (group 2)